jgi:hypothetical protein
MIRKRTFQSLGWLSLAAAGMLCVVWFAAHAGGSVNRPNRETSEAENNRPRAADARPFVDAAGERR